jgi:hypothetical protein
MKLRGQVRGKKHLPNTRRSIRVLRCLGSYEDSTYSIHLRTNRSGARGFIRNRPPKWGRSFARPSIGVAVHRAAR